jgi:hypothetical protein
MPTFAIHHITEIQGKVNIYKLEKDSIILFDLYEMEIEKNKSISGQLKSIQTTLHRIANNYEIPETKYKKLLGCKDDYTEYEIKTKDLRVYIFKEPTTGNVIVIGGKKSTQKEDIRNFRNIKQLYINSKT